MKDGAKAAVAIGVVGAGIAGILALTRKAEAAPENILLSDLVISPAEVHVGEPVEISLIATNIGEIQATKEIVLEVV